MKFRKKPVVIEAWPWPQGDVPSHAKIQDMDSDIDWVCKECGNLASKHGNCPTLEGWHIVCPGDWIIKGIKGEFYPCKPDIFAATYERVEQYNAGGKPERAEGERSALATLLSELLR